MTETRDPQPRRDRDFWKLKQERAALRAQLRHQGVLLDELRDEAIALRIGPRMRHLEDFQTFIGIENVVDGDGRIDFRKLELRVTDLLRRRPELAAPDADVGDMR